jgi:AraC family transcriptional regulator
VKSVPSVTTSLVCELRAGAVSKWLGEGIALSDRQRSLSLNGAGPRIRAVMRSLLDEWRRPGLAHDSMMELLAGQLALEVGRFCARDEGSAAGLAPWRLRRIDARLAEEGAAPSIAELAALCNIGVRQLMRAFKASRGGTLGDHIAQRRAELAKARLRGPDSIKAIAHALGFGSPASFAYAFRKATGLTPRDYRARDVMSRSR